MGNARVEFDESRFPLLVITLRGELQDEDYEEMFSRFERVMKLGRRYIRVTDVRGVTKVADAKRRKWIAERMKAFDAEFGHLALGSIIVLESALIRGGLTALNWLMGKKDPDIWVATMEDAYREVRTIAIEHGLALPPDLRADVG